MPPVIGVMGGHDVTPDVEELAHELGAAVARRGWWLLTGGRNEGVMAAATVGANEAGGFTIGVHPGDRRDPSQAPASLRIFTGIGFARNMVNVLSSDVIVALPGSFGTLSEVAYAQTFGVPTVLLGLAPDVFPDAAVATDVAHAIEQVAQMLPAP